MNETNHGDADAIVNHPQCGFIAGRVSVSGYGNFVYTAILGRYDADWESCISRGDGREIQPALNENFTDRLIPGFT